MRHTAAGKTIKSNVAEKIREQIYQNELKSSC